MKEKKTSSNKSPFQSLFLDFFLNRENQTLDPSKKEEQPNNQ